MVDAKEVALLPCQVEPILIGAAKAKPETERQSTATIVIISNFFITYLLLSSL
jgi:hypothetical protein